MTFALLRDAWAALGGEMDLLDLVEVRGDAAGLLPSTLAALPAMVAAVAASTLAASVLDAARYGGGRPAVVLVDTEHVAVAARSERYAHAEGVRQPGLFAPLSRFWHTADGWLRLHANYAWHHERALRVLGCQDSLAAVEEAVRRCNGEELESALAAAGGLGYLVRDPQQWLAHPQGRAVAGLPLVENVAGPGRGRQLGVGRAAAGARILDLTRVIAGPVATRTLAAWGADVLRVDPPQLPEIPAQALDVLPGKRSAMLDFSDPLGQARLEDLLADADAVVQGYRPGSLSRFGLSAGALAERHPHLSVVTLSAWGARGPWAARRGFDSLVQCATGIAVAEGHAEDPGMLPAQILDHATGYLAAAATMLALAGAERGERARSVRLSLAQTAQWLASAGTAGRDAQRQMYPERFIDSLPGATTPVRVIGPPGRVGDLQPRWTSTTDVGSDPPAFTTKDSSG